MRRPFAFFAVPAALAVLLPSPAAQAQQSGASSNRLMFDPSGMQGSGSRTLQQPSPTTGQNVAPRPPSTPAAGPSTASAPPAAPATKRTTAPKPPARTTTATPARRTSARPAPVDNADSRAAPGTVRASERPIPREQPGALGRLDLPGGSLGYESQTQMKAYDMGDGRRVPGYDNIQRNDSSYFGLSLRMPTSSSGSSSVFGKHGID